MFKKVLGLSLAAALVAMSLAGCSNTAPESVKIGYKTIDNQVEILETAEQAIAEENAQNVASEAQSSDAQASEAQSSDAQASEAQASDAQASEAQSSDTEQQEPVMCYDNPVSISKNSVVQLYAETEPAGSNNHVTWKSDNEELATVDENGKLTIYNAEGAATIVVTTENDLQAILTVNITKTEEELANEELAKAMAELAKETTTPEQAQAKLDELQSKYGNLSDNQKQQLQPAINNLKGAVQDKKTAKANSSAKGNGGSSKPSGGSSKPSGGGSTGGGNTGGGNTGGGNTGGGTPQPAEKYYPTMMPAEMEAYARQVAASLNLNYDTQGLMTPNEGCSWNTPSTTFPGCTNDNIKSNISSGISSLKDSWHNPQVTECRLYAEPTGATDSAGNKQYRIYILY